MLPNDDELKALEQEIANRPQTHWTTEQKALFAEWREDYAAAAERDAPVRSDPLELARQRAKEASKEPNRGKDGPEIG